MLWDTHLLAETLVEKPAVNIANVHTMPNDFLIPRFLGIQADFVS